MQDAVQQDSKNDQPRAGEPAGMDASYGRRLWNYAKSRFNRENWFGSVILIQSWTTGYLKLKASLVRKVHGEDKPDRIRALSNVIPLLGYTWSFLSKRGARFPQGDTVFQRMADALHHPQESSNQFEFLIFFPANVLAIFNNLQNGLKAYGIGLKQGEKAYTPEKARLYSGLLLTLWQGCVGYGHFRKRSDAPPEDENTPLKPGFIGTIQKVWRHDRVLFIGSLINVAMPFISVAEGWNKIRTSREEASKILIASLINIVGAAAYNFYIFQRIARSNFANAGPVGGSESPQNPAHKNLEPDDNAQETRTEFAQKVIKQRQSMQPSPSF